MPTYLGWGITFPVVWAVDVRAEGVCFPVIGLILLLLRFNARRWQRARVGADDVFAVLAWLFVLALGAIFVYAANHEALGWPTPAANGSDNPNNADKPTKTQVGETLNHCYYYIQIFFIPAYGFTKLSWVWFCRRVFVAHRRTAMDIVTLIVTGIVVAWTIAFTFAYIFYCGTHPNALWGPVSQELKYCLNIRSAGAALQLAMAVSDLILEVICVSLPFPMIWRLQLTTLQKVSVTTIFLIGFTTVGISAARIAIYHQVDATGADPQEDTFLAITLTFYWSMLEAGLAFIASQLPTLSQYLTHFPTFGFLQSIRNAVSWITLRSLRSQNSGQSPHNRTDATTVNELPARNNSNATGFSNYSGPSSIAGSGWKKLGLRNDAIIVDPGKPPRRMESNNSLLPTHTHGIGVQRDVDVTSEDLEVSPRELAALSHP